MPCVPSSGNWTQTPATVDVQMYFETHKVARRSVIFQVGKQMNLYFGSSIVVAETDVRWEGIKDVLEPY